MKINDFTCYRTPMFEYNTGDADGYSDSYVNQINGKEHESSTPHFTQNMRKIFGFQFQVMRNNACLKKIGRR